MNPALSLDNLLKLETRLASQLSKSGGELASQGRKTRRIVRTAIISALLLLVLISADNRFSLLQPVHASPSPSKPSVAVNPRGTLGLSSGQTFTIGINVTNAPSNSTATYNGFQVYLQYDYNVVRGVSIDYSTSVLGNNAFVVSECVGGQGNSCNASPYDGVNVVSLVMICLAGSCPSQVPANGTLFKVTFQVIAQGFSDLHLFGSYIAEMPSMIQTPLIPFDGYFTNQLCGLRYCTPPVVSFTLSPYINGTDGNIQIRRDANVTFDGSRSNSTNPNAKIVQYIWDWGDTTLAGNGTSPIASHAYTSVTQGQNQKILTLTVKDSLGAVGSLSVPIEIVLIYLDLLVQSVTADHSQGVVPGAVLNLTAHIKNNSFLPENATVSIDVERTRLGERTLYGLSAFGVSTTSVRWDTSGWTPAVYRIDAVVDPIRNSTGYVIENDTSNNMGIGFIQLIEPMPSGSGLFLGLSLLNTTLVGLVVVIGLGAGAGFIRRLFGRKPLPEEA